MRSSSLSSSGVKDGDLIVLQRTGNSAAHPANGTAGRRVPIKRLSRHFNPRLRSNDLELLCLAMLEIQQAG